MTVAVILFFGTVYAYDKLLMPESGWNPKFSYSEKTLREKMMQSWSYLFTPATACFGVSAVLLVINLMKIGSGEAIILILMAVASVLYVKWASPPI